MCSITNATNGHAAGTPNIIDIRSDTAGIELKEEILKGLRPDNGGEKTLPTLLLYDAKGLKLFEKITYLDEYYLTGEEIEVLERYAEQICDRVEDGSIIVELGSGNLRKIKILLDALEKSGKNVFYYALDLMESELIRTLAAVPDGTFKRVQCAGLLGTYDDGLEWLKRAENVANPKAILSMGSSLGNFTHAEAVDFVAQFAAELKPKDLMLIGIDGCRDADKVWHAYNDSQGVTAEFTLNGLEHANRLMGYEAFKPSHWVQVGEFDQQELKHRAYVVPKLDVNVDGVVIKKGERVKIEESGKFPASEADKIWRDVRAKTGVIESAFFTNGEGSYTLHLLSKPATNFPLAPEQYAPYPVPSLDEWHDLWATWDLVTRKMIPDEELIEKPIKLRNACIFYLAHVPTFFDMKITEATGGKPTEPKYFYGIFERGIDPDVDNPEKVHAHSEVPDTWPPLDEILNFQKNVRKRVAGLYESGQAYNDQWTARAIWLGFEHEIMHLETLLYMLIQSDKTLAPAGTIKPDFEQLAERAKREAVENEWFDIPEQTIQIGLDDPDNAQGPTRYFGWDVEKPRRTVRVKAFKAKARPITNGEYANYMRETRVSRLPASWMKVGTANGTNGVHHADKDAALSDFLRGKAVRTVYGPVPLTLAVDWPVAVSYDELNGCAMYMGGRIPTIEETRSVYHHADGLKTKEASRELQRTIPAVNGHLINNGVQETPPSKPSVNGTSSAVAGPPPRDVFINLEDANVGFQHWHPMPVTSRGDKLSGQGEMGGLWEWTSTVLERADGFEPMKLYPAYSDDFYDGKHNVVLGGSWATHPRVAGRKTFVNWYQRNYPYVWAGARLVKDV